MAKVLKDMGLYEYLAASMATIMMMPHNQRYKKVLNRVLNLKYADQNAIFEAFYERMKGTSRKHLKMVR